MTAATRVPQEQRTRVMRRRLLEATIECLVEHGWSGTSTTLVSQLAGVSRGAQLHHFPTKNVLVLAAIDHLMSVRQDEVLSATSSLPKDDPRRTRAVLAVLSELFTGPLFHAALELWVAARTDPSLRPAVAEIEARVGRATHRCTVEALGVDESLAGNRELVQGTLDLVRGLGLAGIVSDDSQRRNRILDQWALCLDAQFRPRDLS